MGLLVLFATCMFTWAIWLTLRERAGKQPLVVWREKSRSVRIPIQHKSALPDADEICTFLWEVHHTHDLIGQLNKEFPPNGRDTKAAS